MFVGLTRVPDLCFSLLSVSASVPVFLRHVFFISDTHTHTHTHTHTLHFTNHLSFALGWKFAPLI